MKLTNSYKKRHFKAALLLIFFAAAGPLSAQPLLYNPQAIAIPNPLTMLLRNQPVHTELRLTDEQLKKVDQAVSPVELSLWQLRDTPSALRHKKDQELLDQLWRQLEEILSKEQLRRFEQIHFQAKDLSVFLDTRIGAKLGISQSQEQEICTALINLNLLLEKLQNNPALTAMERTRQIQQQQLKATGEVMKVFSEDQRQKVHTLGGRPFDFTRIIQKACRAPEFQQVTEWLNIQPLRLSSFRGKVVAVHFYALSCVNCKNNLPHYASWQKQFPSDKFAVIGIHRPELAHEEEVETVRKNAQDEKMTYPIALDNDGVNWDAWGNSIWPSVYIIDKEGFIRYWWYGELNWQGTQGEEWMRTNIKSLLKE